MKESRLNSNFVILFLTLFFAGSGCAREFDLKTPAEIQSEIEARQNGFEQCYSEALVRNRSATGDVAIILNIEADTGAVSSVEISHSEIDDTDFMDCIKNTAVMIKLKNPRDFPIKGHYTLNFLYRE